MGHFEKVQQCISHEMNGELLKPFTDEEIWVAVKGIAPLKASEIDGFLPLFYQQYWHILGPKVSSYFLAVLRGDVAVEEINSAHVVLILKMRLWQRLGPVKRRYGLQMSLVSRMFR